MIFSGVFKVCPTLNVTWPCSGLQRSRYMSIHQFHRLTLTGFFFLRNCSRAHPDLSSEKPDLLLLLLLSSHASKDHVTQTQVQCTLLVFMGKQIFPKHLKQPDTTPDKVGAKPPCSLCLHSNKTADTAYT